jgi:hypothetical protein
MSDAQRNQAKEQRAQVRRALPLEQMGGKYRMNEVSEEEEFQVERNAMLQLSVGERFQVLEQLRRQFYGNPPTRQQLIGFYRVVKRKIG